MIDLQLVLTILAVLYIGYFAIGFIVAAYAMLVERRLMHSLSIIAIMIGWPFMILIYWDMKHVGDCEPEQST